MTAFLGKPTSKLTYIYCFNFMKLKSTNSTHFRSIKCTKEFKMLENHEIEGKSIISLLHQLNLCLYVTKIGKSYCPLS